MILFVMNTIIIIIIVRVIVMNTRNSIHLFMGFVLYCGGNGLVSVALIANPGDDIPHNWIAR